jgi:hypothetical protein
LHNKSNTAIDDLGVYFSATAPTAAGTGMLAGAPSPQISNPFGSVIMDTLNWTLISGTYTATGGEQFLTIGHLKSDAATTYLAVPFGSQGAYYYIDDVSLKEVAVLPVLLSSFNADLISEQTINPFAEITWSTATEINNCCFYIEKSEDGINYTDIGMQAGHGNSTQQNNYLFYDRSPFPGLNYYRLRQMDLDGNSTISNTITVTNNLNESNVHVYQNGDLLHFTNHTNGDLIAEIYDISGARTQTLYIVQGNSDFLSDQNLTGIFVITISDPESGFILASQKIFRN